MEYKVDFSSPIIFLDGNEFGHVGEKNRAILVITPPTDMMECADVRHICLVCEVGREFVKTVVKSELYDKEEEIRIPLWEDATVSETGKLQIEGSDSEGNILYKSDLVEFSLKPSASGVSPRPFEPSEPSDNEPKLTKEEMFSDYETGLIHTKTMSQTITIECASLPVNARVRKIEIPDVFNDTDNYLLLEDMVSYEPVPYSVMYPKNMQGEFFPVAALVTFSNTTNRFYDAAELNLLESKTIKIYYEIEE